MIPLHTRRNGSRNSHPCAKGSFPPTQPQTNSFFGVKIRFLADESSTPSRRVVVETEVKIGEEGIENFDKHLYTLSQSLIFCD
jgi:hypothetical protein